MSNSSFATDLFSPNLTSCKYSEYLSSSFKLLPLANLTSSFSKADKWRLLFSLAPKIILLKSMPFKLARYDNFVLNLPRAYS